MDILEINKLKKIMDFGVPNFRTKPFAIAKQMQKYQTT